MELTGLCKIRSEPRRLGCELISRCGFDSETNRRSRARFLRNQGRSCWLLWNRWNWRRRTHERHIAANSIRARALRLQRRGKGSVDTGLHWLLWLHDREPCGLRGNWLKPSLILKRLAIKTWLGLLLETKLWLLRKSRLLWHKSILELIPNESALLRLD